jgi:hypothetical protein
LLKNIPALLAFQACHKKSQLKESLCCLKNLLFAPSTI